MARVVFTANLERHIACPPSNVAGKTLGDVLEAAFQENPQLRGYIFDDQDRLRKHIALFIDGRIVGGRCALNNPVAEDSEIYVMQALSGG